MDALLACFAGLETLYAAGLIKVARSSTQRLAVILAHILHLVTTRRRAGRVRSYVYSSNRFRLWALVRGPSVQLFGCTAD